MSDDEVPTALRCASKDCGAAVPAGAKFCQNCGVPLNEQQRRTSSARIRAVRHESVTAPPLTDVVRSTIARLRKEKPAAGRVLVEQGERILGVLVSTTVVDEERAEAAQAIFGWHQNALDLLTSKGYSDVR